MVMPMFQETQEHVSVALFCFSHHNTLLFELKNVNPPNDEENTSGHFIGKESVL